MVLNMIVLLLIKLKKIKALRPFKKYIVYILNHTVGGAFNHIITTKLGIYSTVTIKSDSGIFPYFGRYATRGYITSILA